QMREAALRLATEAPRAVALGAYWDTYLLAGLAPVGRVVPVPLEGEVLRTPWTPHVLGTVDHVFLVRGPDTRDAPLPPSIDAYGQHFALIDPLVFENELFRIARYARPSVAR
ncbi:MAG: hypothetical protein NZ518_11910, partial [Dehalococcoidia bacterium]|nr:hypothetical protein [Dehalococcoidia bacterium]